MPAYPRGSRGRGGKAGTPAAGGGKKSVVKQSDALKHIDSKLKNIILGKWGGQIYGRAKADNKYDKSDTYDKNDK